MDQQDVVTFLSKLRRSLDIRRTELQAEADLLDDIREGVGEFLQEFLSATPAPSVNAGASPVPAADAAPEAE